MQRTAIFQFFLIALAITLVSSANILDLLYWNLGKSGNIEKRDDNVDTSGDKTCYCNGPSCMCCVDFNMTLIDFGGPGCVSMKYLSQDEGLMVNVSYGDSLLHNAHVRGPDPPPTCIVILKNFAEICARFASLQSHNDGLRGCLQLEPKLLDDIQTQFNIGCFTMGPNGMKLDEVAPTAASQAQTIGNKTNSQNETDGFSEEELLAVVNESAQQGLAFLGNLFGINFNNNQDNNSTETGEEESVTEAEGN